MLCFGHDFQQVMRRGRAFVVLLLASTTLWIFGYSFLSTSAPGRLTDVLESALFDPQGATPELALGVFVLLVFLRRSRLRATFGRRPNFWASSMAFVFSLGILLWSEAIRAPDLGRLSFIFATIGGGYWLGGHRLVRLLGVPLFVIALSVPLPLAITNQILLPLQLATSHFASAMLSVLGVSHVVSSDQIFKGDLIFHVIEGCSGFRTIYSLLLASVVYAEVVCHRKREKLLLIAVAPIIAFVVNGIRVVVLILRETPSDAPEHALQGILMIVFGVLALAGVESLIFPRMFGRSRAGASIRSEDRLDTATSTAASSFDLRLASLVVVVSVFLALTMIAPNFVRLAPPNDRFNVEEVAMDFDGWAVTQLRRDANFLGSTRFRHLIYRAYTRDNERVALFLAAEDRRSRNLFGWSPKTEIPRPAWRSIEELQPARIGEHLVARRIIHYARGAQLIYHWRVGYAGWLEELFRNWLSLDHTSWRIAGPSLVIRLEANIADSTSGLERADRLLRGFAERLEKDVNDSMAR